LHEIFNFRVAVSRGGATIEAGFARAGPIESALTVATYREAGARFAIKDPDEISFGDVTLERGASRNPLFATWMSDAIKAITGIGRGAVIPPFYKGNVTIFQNNRKKEGRAEKTYTLFNAMPIAFRAGDWDNSRDEIVIESLTLTYDYYTLKVEQNPRVPFSLGT
jgi:phage tail-like protein